MRNVRIIFTKKDRLKFLSHLDMNRFMTRVLRRSKMPIWYTEGFNPHPYVTFALPLSLGFESEYEVMDIRIEDDSFSNADVKKSLEKAMPEYIKIIDVFDPVLKPGKIAFAKFLAEFISSEQLEIVNNIYSLDEIAVEKRGKKGKVSVIDLKPHIKELKTYEKDGRFFAEITLPAGGDCNINPTLFFGNVSSDCIITRLAILDADGNLFR